MIEDADVVRIRLKSFTGPWTRKGRQILLACKKCQGKLREDGDPEGLGRLRKLLKQRLKAGDVPTELIVIQTGCLKVCPRKGVAVCTQAQLGAGRGSIVRSVADVDLLCAEIASDALALAGTA